MSDLDNFKKRVAETINDTKPARVAGECDLVEAEI